MAAAAPAILVEASQYLESQIAPLPVEETVRELVHDLRQPLSSIEAIAYYLEMTLPAEQFRERQYMRRIQQLVNQASSALTLAAAPARTCGSVTN